ncbi:copper resistance CopC family protein [Pseudemcibacter aquimaris]|uniref:copper resistance CopC family protein n=1 Tax=Pseudemcibacter aquimaris TaxID=2857064 RepID=UPI00201188ED|nr:copper resistance protein CopC [Pseudemcibacter aquimaris]MCC3860746.1 copper resistance protein CopC [Pseudemcibacter aquimaris]WDU59565.1 copper resistance protein CopC [Pseudemcibacter aquimaris]
MELTNAPNKEEKMNRILNLVTIVAFSAVLTSQALAHSDTKMTVPDNEAILDEVPETISIHMAKKIRLTKVEMQHEDHEILEIDTSEYKSFQTEFTLPIEPMGTGIYNITWRALGQDGHPIEGAFQFTVME